MSSSLTRAVFERWTVAMTTFDFETLRDLIHPDYVQDWPQSGERVHGFAAFRAILESYPGGLVLPMEPETAQLMHGEEHWVMTPGYTVIPLAGGGAISSVHRTRYPDGSAWYVVSFITLKDGKVWRATTYFAPEYPAPEWRAHLVERIEGSSGRPSAG